jgi:hypothetical protein
MRLLSPRTILVLLALGLSSCASGVYRLTDSGVRCARAPCPSILASPAGVGTGVRVSSIQFPSAMSQEERTQVANRIYSPEGLLCEGFVWGQGDDRVFVLDNVLEP